MCRRLSYYRCFHKEKDMHFLNRAKEMGIQVIFDVYMMDEVDLAEDLAHFDRRNTCDICT